MKKITFTTALLLLLIQPLLSQEIQIVPNANTGFSNLNVTGIHANESDSVRYDYLWWFGDGAYAIKTKLTKPTPNTTHKYLVRSGLNSSLGSNNQNAYMTTLITTENYGHSGNPDLIHIGVPNSPLILQGIANTNNSMGPIVNVEKFRNAVPGDIFYLLVTYRLPQNFDCLDTLTEGTIVVSFGAERDFFEYVKNADGVYDKSFLPHKERFSSASNGAFSWKVPLYGMQKGEERTILLPFKYTGRIQNGRVDIEVNFRASKENKANYLATNKSCSINESTTTYLQFAKSHDPNSIAVNIESVEDCKVGGRELEYTVHFENIGDGPANYVKIEVQLEDAHDLSDLQITKLPKSVSGMSISEGELVGYDTYLKNRINNWQVPAARFKRDFQNNTITFEFYTDNLLLGRDANKHPSVSQDSIKFKIRIKDDYIIGDDPIVAYAIIVFDGNKAVGTNVAKTRCIRPACITEKACCPKENTYLVWILVGIIVIVILLILMFWCLCRRRRSQH